MVLLESISNLEELHEMSVVDVVGTVVLRRYVLF